MREYQRFVAFGEDFSEAFEEDVEFGAGMFGVFLVDEAGMAGGLAEAQKGFEDLDFGFGDAVFADLVEQGVAVVLAQIVVEGALAGFEFAVEGLLDFRG